MRVRSIEFELPDAARRRIILKRKIEVAKAERNVFRQEHVAPLHSCPECMRGFVSAWHLKDHESRKPSELYCEEEEVCYNHLKLFDENDVRQVRRECRRVEREARDGFLIEVMQLAKTHELNFHDNRRRHSS